MSDFRERFRSFSHEEMSSCIRELEAQATRAGRRLLTTEEIEELLALLPADYFRALFRMRIKETARGRMGFEEKLEDLESAVERISAHCLGILESEDEDASEECLFRMDQLRVLHPAVWFRLYQRLRKESLAIAVELEAEDKDVPFKKV